MGRACLKEGLKGVKVRFRRKKYAGRGQDGHLLFAERRAFGHRHRVRARRAHFRKQGHVLILQVIVVWSANRKLSKTEGHVLSIKPG